MTKPTKAQATEAARSYMRHRDNLGDHPAQADLLMGLGRLYEFPPDTPALGGEPTIASVAAFILQHAVEIE